MAAPLSGLGQQNIPLAQPFQPGGTDQTRAVRQPDQEPREEEVQAREAAAARSQEANTQRQNSERGSIVDVVV
ncbi:MAG: hypothetical protein GC137_05020 [Alphaproteobacteria bacterium]|nr:hypothetical protein [Alphaproteobacteria bacterium]